MYEDEDELDDVGYTCGRCGLGQRAMTQGSIEDALAGALLCFRVDGRRADRAHVEAVHDLFGAYALPLEPRVAERARAANPQLADAAILVAPVDATLVDPVESWTRRVERLIELHAPDIVIDRARASLARASANPVRLEWERVRAWPAVASYPGTIGYGVVARTTAALVFESLVPGESERLLAPIDRAIAELRLDLDGFGERARFVDEIARAETTGDLRRRLAFRFAVRCLDELGHTGLRDDQDTLVDAAHGALLHARRDADARSVFSRWFEVAVPAARAAIAEQT